MAEPITTESRRIERERAMSLLYEAEIKGIPIAEVISALPVQPTEFVVDTVTSVEHSHAQLDSEISNHAIGWDLDRMASVDRAILRIGAFELQGRSELSTAVIISEAVELAKRFSSEDSGKFVNGILSAIARDVRGDEAVLR